MKLIELCVLKLDHDWFPLLDLLAIVLNPMSRYQRYLPVTHFHNSIAVVLRVTLYAACTFASNFI